MLLGIFFSLVGILGFLYLFWKKLREDYTVNQLFSAGFYSLFGLLVGGLVSLRFFSNWAFWASILGSYIGLMMGIRRQHIKFFEALEAWVLASLGVLVIFYFYMFIKSPNLQIQIALLVSGMLFGLFLLSCTRYKKFRWYKSGRLGFAGLATLGVGFLVRSIIALAFSDVLFFVGNIDAILSGILAFVAFLMLYNLSQKEI